jgi:hypothetical protein
MYSIRLLDTASNCVATFSRLVEFSMNRKLNDAWEVSFGIRRTEANVHLLDMGKEVMVYDGSLPALRGVITERDFSGSTWKYRAESSAVYLKRLRTPGQWSLAGMSPEAAIADLTKGFCWVNQGTGDDWSGAVYNRTEVKTLFDGDNVIMLARDSNGRYYESGDALLPVMDLGEDCTEICRLRWRQDKGEACRVTLRIRMGNVPIPDATWTGWSVEYETIDCENGVVIDGVDKRYAQVRVFLYTTDTVSPNPAGEPQGFSPVFYAVEVVGRTHNAVTPAITSVSGLVLPEDMIFDYEDHLAVISRVCDFAGWRFYVDHMAVLRAGHDDHLGSQDLSEQVIFRENVNCGIQSYKENKDNIENVVLALGAGEGVGQLKLVVRNEASIAKYGERWGTYTNTNQTVRANLLAEAEAYVDQHADPIVEVTLDFRSLPSTWPGFKVGDKVRFISEARGVNVVLRVAEEERNLAGGKIGLNTSLQPMRDLLVDMRKMLKGPPITQAVPPVPPVNLSAIGYNGGIIIKWSGICESWTIEHTAEESNGLPINWKTLAVVLQTRYDHTGLALGSKHYYRVRANKGELHSDWVQTAGTLAKDVTPPSAPTNLSATNGPGKSIDISWTAPVDTDVKEYEVWRKDGNYPNDPAGATKLAEISATRFLDTTGVVDAQYTWYVRAVDTAENVSGWPTGATAVVSAEIDTTPPASLAAAAMSATAGTAYVDGEGGLFVRCTITLNPAPVDPKRAYIQFKYRVSGSANYHLADQLRISGGTVVVVIDDLAPSTPYEFAAVPVSYYGVEGEGKTCTVTTVGDPGAPPAPLSVVVTEAFAKLIVSWTPPADKRRVAGYEVHCHATDSNFTPTDLTKVWAGDAVIAAVDLGVGVSVYVKVVSVSPGGSRSAGVAPVNNVLYSTATISETDITDHSITTQKIAVGAVTADLIHSGAIKAIHIEAGAITANEINADTVIAKNLALLQAGTGAPNGQIVSLREDWPESRPPAIIVMPQELQQYEADYAAFDQRTKVWAEAPYFETVWKFVPYCMLVTPGAGATIYVYDLIDPRTYNTWTSANSSLEATELRITIEAEGVVSHSSGVRWIASYYSTQTGWVTFGRYDVIIPPGSPPKTETHTLTVADLPSRIYKVRVQAELLPGYESVSRCMVVSWAHAGDVVIFDGLVSWLAIG